MSNAISRRAFLKCAGASVLAVGAASLLGGCNWVEQIGNASGVATCTMGGNVMVSVATKTRWWDSEYIDPIGIALWVKNRQDKEITLKATDITNVTINGHKAKVLTNTDETIDAEKYQGYVSELSLFRDGDSKTYPSDKNWDMNSYVEGYVFFVPDYADGEEKLKAPWTNVRFTLKLNGETKTFEVNRSGDNITSKTV